MSKRCAAVSCKQTTYYSPTFLIDLDGPKVYHSKAELRLSEQYLLDPMNLVLDTFGFFVSSAVHINVLEQLGYLNLASPIAVS